MRSLIIASLWAAAAAATTALVSANPLVDLEARQIGVASGLAPLEPASGVLFGVWYNGFSGSDSPKLINERFNHKPLSFYQQNINIPEDLALVPKMLEHLEATESDAFLYLTVYPMTGFGNVTEAKIDELIVHINAGLKQGRRFMIRYAPEMNGSWFVYGQQPAAFLASWKTFVDRVRKGVSDKRKVAFLWAPNSSNGYPFPGGLSSPTNNSVDVSTLDTNKDGKYDFGDDPYSPFYPGDEWVDWVGLSMYHYGAQYPWVDNVLPKPGVVDAMLEAGGNMSAYNFYTMFSGNGTGPRVTTPVSKGGKPFIIAENAATFHLGFLKKDQAETLALPLNAGPGMLAIKQAWWRQIFDKQFLATHPKIKAICNFEFKKQEEETLREFRSMGDYETPNPDTDENKVFKAFRDDLIAMGDVLRWAHTGSANSATAGGPLSCSILALVLGLVSIATGLI
ncbi:glycoside hydrolase superfamily [Phlyctochytrium arcticum]|nr:glycoside hydrolase superfamily [Phlyctochytrium arcticum]